VKRLRLAASAMLVALVAAGCIADSSVDTTTTPPTPAPPPTSTTTEPERCPDVFCLFYRVRPGSVWSDGRPVTAQDFAHTLALFTDPMGPPTGNPGYDLVTEFEVIDDQTLMVVMSEVFAPWRTLFGAVFPAHWEFDRSIPGPSSGPFVFSHWVDGEPVVLARNPHYSGPQGGGDVEFLSFVTADGARDVIAGLRRGNYHLGAPTPRDWVIEDLLASDGVITVIAPGPFWEHITFNHSDPLLGRPYIRQALAAALDREAILDATVRRLDRDAVALGNTLWMPSSPWYRDHFVRGHDPEESVAILEQNGCGRGDDGVFVCEGRRMSFVWATTVGDELRGAQVEAASAMLAGVGIEILPWKLSPADLFSSPVFFGDSTVWQLMSFAWRADADPFLAKSLYQCVGDGPHGMGLLNAARYCNPEVDDLVSLSRSMLGPAARASALNEADSVFLGEVAMIPLYQRPAVLAWSDELTGPEVNAWSTDLWNAGAWTGVRDVVIAVDQEPVALISLVPDGAAGMITRALYLGAYLVFPDGTFIPALVEEVEVVVRGSEE
jgi:peptide/nickel transport system substrate-binding protein